jgi:hypothetical protein
MPLENGHENLTKKEFITVEEYCKPSPGYFLFASKRKVELVYS